MTRAVYFIKSGKVAAVMPKFSNFKFLKIQQGYYFGEVDIFFNHSCRKNTFMATKHTQLLVLHKEHLEQLIYKQYKSIGEEMRLNAGIRIQKMTQMQKEAEELLDSNSAFLKKSNTIKLATRGSVYKANSMKPGGYINELMSRLNMSIGSIGDEKTPKEKEIKREQEEGSQQDQVSILSFFLGESKEELVYKKANDLQEIIKEFGVIVEKMQKQEKALWELKRNLASCNCQQNKKERRDCAMQTNTDECQFFEQKENKVERDFGGMMAPDDPMRLKEESQEGKEGRRSLSKNKFEENEAAGLRLVSRLSQRTSTRSLDERVNGQEETKSDKGAPEHEEWPAGSGQKPKETMKKMKEASKETKEESRSSFALKANTFMKKHNETMSPDANSNKKKPVVFHRFASNGKAFENEESIRFSPSRQKFPKHFNHKNSERSKKTKENNSYEAEGDKSPLEFADENLNDEHEFTINNKMSLADMYNNFSRNNEAPGVHPGLFSSPNSSQRVLQQDQGEKSMSNDNSQLKLFDDESESGVFKREEEFFEFSQSEEFFERKRKKSFNPKMNTYF